MTIDNLDTPSAGAGLCILEIDQVFLHMTRSVTADHSLHMQRLKLLGSQISRPGVNPRTLLDSQIGVCVCSCLK